MEARFGGISARASGAGAVRPREPSLDIPPPIARTSLMISRSSRVCAAHSGTDRLSSTSRSKAASRPSSRFPFDAGALELGSRSASSQHACRRSGKTHGAFSSSFG